MHKNTETQTKKLYKVDLPLMTYIFVEQSVEFLDLVEINKYITFHIVHILLMTNTKENFYLKERRREVFRKHFYSSFTSRHTILVMSTFQMPMRVK